MAPASRVIYTLSLHDALPISGFFWTNWVAGGTERHAGSVRTFPSIVGACSIFRARVDGRSCCAAAMPDRRSEEHTSELQSPCNLVCRLLLEKKNRMRITDQEK